MRPRRELRSFAEEHGIPVVSTMMGIGAPTEHPLYYGMVGNNGKTYANPCHERIGSVDHGGSQSGRSRGQSPDSSQETKCWCTLSDPAEIGKMWVLPFHW